MNIPGLVMLIDDDPDDQLFFRDAIEVILPGLPCAVVNNFREALRQLECHPLPDFIFMDLNMPVMNGFDCLVYLKNHPAFKNIPVVIFTTSRNVNDMNRTLQLGASSFLTKPDDFNILCNKLKKILLSAFEIQ